jgi:hypothetical protein
VSKSIKDIKKLEEFIKDKSPKYYNKLLDAINCNDDLIMSQSFFTEHHNDFGLLGKIIIVAAHYNIDVIISSTVGTK